MRLLDTREQKSPRFLLEAFPDLTITTLEVGDYFSGERKKMRPPPRPGDCEVHYYDMLVGNLLEIKIGKDFGIHTEQLERFQDECCRMSCYRQQNPHVQLHAVWVCSQNDYKDDWLFIMKIFRAFDHYCHKYHVWGHFLTSEHALINFLKTLDQAPQYQEFAPYIKKSHEEPTILAKMLRQFPGISSPMAIALAKNLNSSMTELCDVENLYALDPCDRNTIIDTIGRKKTGDPKKLATDLIRWLETGETP